MIDVPIDNSKASLVSIMLELVRAAVLERNPVIPSSDEIDWDRLMDISTKQGLVAWVWDGICKLPIEYQLPRQQRINWALSAQSYWEDYEEKCQALNYMLDVCQQNNIRLLLLKGLGLSVLYPKPQSRSSGDIDIFLFKDFQKGNILFYGKKIRELTKHTTMIVKGVSVDNHRMFFEPATRQKRKVNRYLKSSLVEVCLTSKGYYLFNPLPNLIFLCQHTLKHFDEDGNIPIRGIMDFAFFIDSNKKDIDPNKCHDILAELRLLEGFELLICLAERILYVTIRDFHFTNIPQDYLDGLIAIISQDSYGDSQKFEKEKQVEYILRYVPSGLRRTRRRIILRRCVVFFFRFIFFIPQGESFKKTMRKRFSRLES